MKNEIPIILTNNATLRTDGVLRQPTPARAVWTHDDDRGHRTPPPMITRTRRISSSTAAKKFPKDFFGSEPRKTMKINSLLKTQSHKEPDSISRHEDSPDNQHTPEFKKGGDSKHLRKQPLSHKQPQNNHKAEHPEQYISLKQIPGFEVFKIPKLANNHLKQGLSDVTFQTNNFQVTLGQKINHALMNRKERQRKRMAKLKHIDPQRLLLGLQGETIKKEGGFRIRKGLV